MCFDAPVWLSRSFRFKWYNSGCSWCILTNEVSFSSCFQALSTHTIFILIGFIARLDLIDGTTSVGDTAICVSGPSHNKRLDFITVNLLSGFYCISRVALSESRWINRCLKVPVVLNGYNLFVSGMRNRNRNRRNHRIWLEPEPEPEPQKIAGSGSGK